MKAEKSPPTHLANAFFIEDFSFSLKHRRAFGVLGISGDVITELEEVVAFLRSYYESGQALPPRQIRKALETLHNALRECVDKLDQADRSTLSILNAAVPLKTGGVAMLRTLLAEYGDGAQKVADRIPVHGPDASKDDHVARAVGEALKNSGVPLDDSEKGIFVIATGIVFEVMDIHKSTPRNAVRRALGNLAKS